MLLSQHSWMYFFSTNLSKGPTHNCKKLRDAEAHGKLCHKNSIFNCERPAVPMKFLDNIGEEPERESNPLIISPTNRSSLSLSLPLSPLRHQLLDFWQTLPPSTIGRSHPSWPTDELTRRLSLSHLEAAGLSYKLVVGLKLETVKVGQA